MEQGAHDRQIETARSVARVAELFVAATITSDLAEVTRLRQEAENISDHELTAEVRERLQRLRTDMQKWIGDREPEPDHDAEDVDEPSEALQLTAFAEARVEFEWLVQEIRAAQEVGDLAVVDTARRLAGPVYARRLSPPDREEYTPFMREVKAWCREHDPEKQVDPSLRRIRQLLAELGRGRGTRSADELADTFDEIGRLRSRLAQPLPTAENREVRRWRRQLKDQKPAKREGSAPMATTAPRNASPQQGDGTVDLRHAGRLPIETIDKLATGVREILADAARSGGRLLTWGDLRLRMGGGLPHLHPDDQGELLVTVDRETPADEPLLSTLVTSTDESLHWLYRHVRFSLGRERIPASELEAHWATEVLRLRQIWRHR
ncbi:hypothetical protein [Streptomyces sp. SLBN-8D4]|uniref:hypothetical protein n=1 Tax=Streptomyces sp. SLBN-8D4 TaxID=3377728 RepID=UPI003C7E1625